MQHNNFDNSFSISLVTCQNSETGNGKSIIIHHITHRLTGKGCFPKSLDRCVFHTCIQRTKQRNGRRFHERPLLVGTYGHFGTSQWSSLLQQFTKPLVWSKCINRLKYFNAKLWMGWCYNCRSWVVPAAFITYRRIDEWTSLTKIFWFSSNTSPPKRWWNSSHPP